MVQLLIIIINLYCFNIKLPLYRKEGEKNENDPVNFNQTTSKKLLTEVSSQERQVAIRMRDVINQYFITLNTQTPSSLTKATNLHEFLFSILQQTLTLQNPHSVATKATCTVILNFFISYIKHSKNPTSLIL